MFQRQQRQIMREEHCIGTTWARAESCTSSSCHSSLSELAFEMELDDLLDERWIPEEHVCAWPAAEGDRENITTNHASCPLDDGVLARRPTQELKDGRNALPPCHNQFAQKTYEMESWLVGSTPPSEYNHLHCAV